MDYRFRPAPASDMENYEFLADTKGKETAAVPMGPLHITSDEPGHFRRSWRARHRSTPTTACSTCIAVWRRSPRRA